MSEFASLQGMIGVRDTYAPFTLAQLESLAQEVGAISVHRIWTSRAFTRRMRRGFSFTRKSWHAPKRYRRAVHRAYRKCGGLP